ncbi:hypothetical protein HPP92_018617 [Vanilla planifolia]|uniref:Uncharacterized protein n=1 Tax=Vanilla planifolia TaxID=51239 RepID=A0A835Q8F4_VANPL|nr:hypothetical protein HPP92_019209 [Vanilla planifolia]KAG0469289.1 hypothetical protein HPP92_018617 [Vanilla planifolia]
MKKRNSNAKVLKIFLLGAIAKLGATMVTYPINVVKSRLQAKQGFEIDRRHHYQGTWDAIRKMIRYEGISGSTKEWALKLYKACLLPPFFFHGQGGTRECSEIASHPQTQIC